MLFFFFLFIGLIWRGVAIEFRNKESMKWWRQWWDVIYTFSSSRIAFTLGLILGNVVYGLRFNENGDFTGHFSELFNPYSVITAITSLALFMMHGAVIPCAQNRGRAFYQDHDHDQAIRSFFHSHIHPARGRYDSLYPLYRGSFPELP